MNKQQKYLCGEPQRSTTLVSPFPNSHDPSRATGSDSNSGNLKNGSNYYHLTSSASSLPNLRNKPRFAEILKSLKILEVEASYNNDETLEDSRSTFKFLMSVATSSMEWLEDLAQDKKDVLYELAAKRIAERCGRSAISEINRTFVIPASEAFPELKIDIREPGIVEDNLGFKTWGTAHAIAKKLEEIGQKYFHHLVHTEANDQMITMHNGSTFTRVKSRVLELGAGTGLVGIAASKLWKCTVIATDLPHIHDNLLFNVRKNNEYLNPIDVSGTLKERHGFVLCEELDWKNPENALADYSSKEFEIVIATDPIYDDEHPQLVASMIEKYIARNIHSRALVAIPIRDSYSELKAEHFTSYMKEYGLDLLYQGEENFIDADWKNANGGESEAVKCWWAIWRLRVQE